VYQVRQAEIFEGLTVEVSGRSPHIAEPRQERSFVGRELG
jgi:hypothetical protein